MFESSRVTEVAISAVPSLCGRRGRDERRFHIHHRSGSNEELVTIRVTGPDSEVVVAAVRQWLEALLTSGGITMSGLRHLDIRANVVRDCPVGGMVVPVPEEEPSSVKREPPLNKVA